MTFIIQAYGSGLKYADIRTHRLICLNTFYALNLNTAFICGDSICLVNYLTQLFSAVYNTMYNLTS